MSPSLANSPDLSQIQLCLWSFPDYLCLCFLFFSDLPSILFPVTRVIFTLGYCSSLLLMTNSDRLQVLSFLHLNISPSPVTHLISTLNLPIYHFSMWWTLKVVHLTSSLEPSDLSNECSVAFFFQLFFSPQSCYYIFANLSSFFRLIALLNVFVSEGFAFFTLLEEACIRCMCTRIMYYKNYVREILCFMFYHSSV